MESDDELDNFRLQVRSIQKQLEQRKHEKKKEKGAAKPHVGVPQEDLDLQAGNLNDWWVCRRLRYRLQKLPYSVATWIVLQYCNHLFVCLFVCFSTCQHSLGDR